MNFVKADCGDKMGLYFDVVGYYSDQFGHLKVTDVIFMYLDTDTDEDYPVIIAQIGTNEFHIHWFDGQTLVEKTGDLDYVKSFLEPAYEFAYGK